MAVVLFVNLNPDNSKGGQDIISVTGLRWMAQVQFQTFDSSLMMSIFFFRRWRVAIHEFRRRRDWGPVWCLQVFIAQWYWAVPQQKVEQQHFLKPDDCEKIQQVHSQFLPLQLDVTAMNGVRWTSHYINSASSTLSTSPVRTRTTWHTASIDQRCKRKCVDRDATLLVLGVSDPGWPTAFKIPSNTRMLERHGGTFQYFATKTYSVHWL